MNTQTRIILFCYAYLVGIVLTMVWMPDPIWMPMLWGGFAMATVFALVVYARALFRPGGARPGWARESALLVLPALLLGVCRYMQANTMSDRRIGVLRVAPGRAEFRLERDLPDLSRISIRKTREMKGDLVLRVHGELDARIAVTNEQGLPRLDGQNRWAFHLAKVTRSSDPIIVRQWDPVGTEYLVPQPFNRIAKIEILESPGEGEVAVYRISNHIRSFAYPGRDHPPVLLLGRITADPDVYDFKTVLTVTPDFIQTADGGPFFRAEGGDVHVVLKPDVAGYSEFARSDAYGKNVAVYGELSIARASANPGSFDPRRFMQNHNVYGIVSVFQAPGGSPPIRIVEPDGDRPRAGGNDLVRFSLRLRDRMLRVFKLTMPYPQSAFLAGVTLGMRYGLQGVECLLSARRPHSAEGESPAHTECRELIADEFKASGVNHVLAVSGLHVTIVTVMFMGLFALARIPRQMYVPVLILILVIFAIITGARPSVLRAVIMHGLFLLTWAYAGQGLRSSVLLGVPVAAFLILLQNPLVIVDPSFTLSFGAILSLGLLTEPIHDVLSQLRGNRFLAFLIIVVVTTLIGVARWPLLLAPRFMLIYVGVCAALWWGAARLEARGRRFIGELGFVDIPPGVSAFIAAQFAIQIGMMIPLSAYYFCRWPFAGAYANFVAIPLIGVVVQLGVMAGLVGLIPSIGLYLALVLNAANWVFSTVFLLVAHFFASLFPFPFVRRPSVGALLSYYLLCAAFIWREAWTRVLREHCERWGWTRPFIYRTSIAAVLLAATLPAWPWFRSRSSGTLRITVLSLGYGEATLIETPGGRNVLVDCGFVEYERGRHNDAIRSILPFLSHERIRRLDAVILTSPAPERLAGASHILEHCWVNALYVPPTLSRVLEEPAPEEFYQQLSGGNSVEAYHPDWLFRIYAEAVGDPLWPHRLSLAKALNRRRPTMLNRWADWMLGSNSVKAPNGFRSLHTGDVLLRETVNGKEFRIEVVSCGEPPSVDHPIENGSAVLRVVYGKFSMMFTGDLHFEGQRRLASDVAVRTDILLYPHHGTAMPWGSSERMKGELQALWNHATRPFLERVQPRKVIFNFGNTRPVLGRQARNADRAFELTWRWVTTMFGEENCLRTDRDLAIFITSDGETSNVTTQAEKLRAAGTDEDALDVTMEL